MHACMYCIKARKCITYLIRISSAMAVKFFVATLIGVLLVETGFVRADPLSTKVFTEVAETQEFG